MRKPRGPPSSLEETLRAASTLGTALLLAASSCGMPVNLGATLAEDLPGNDAGAADGAAGTGGTAGLGNTPDAALDGPSDSGLEPDGPLPGCREFYPRWELPLTCQVSLPPLAELVPPFVFLGMNLLYRTPLGDERVIGYVDSEAACSGVGEGWYLVDPFDPRQIVLCPETCSALIADGGRLFAAFGCARSRAEPL